MVMGKIELTEVELFFERCAVWIRGDIDRSHVVGPDEILRHHVGRNLLFGFGVVGRSDSSGTGSNDIGRWCVGDAKGKRGHQTESWGWERFVMVYNRWHRGPCD
jgi:hypothetical protein